MGVETGSDEGDHCFTPAPTCDPSGGAKFMCQNGDCIPHEKVLIHPVKLSSCVTMAIVPRRSLNFSRLAHVRVGLHVICVRCDVWLIGWSNG